VKVRNDGLSWSSRGAGFDDARLAARRSSRPIRASTRCCASLGTSNDSDIYIHATMGLLNACWTQKRKIISSTRCQMHMMRSVIAPCHVPDAITQPPMFTASRPYSANCSLVSIRVKRHSVSSSCNQESGISDRFCANRESVKVTSKERRLLQIKVITVSSANLNARR
jgi:hypothetical protein